MARKTKELPVVANPVSQPHAEADSMTLNAASLMTAQQDAVVRAAAAQIGYQLPADCTDPDLIQRDISSNMRRSVEACLEVGRGLAVLKAACGHGNFMARLDVLGIEARVAQKFTQAAVKFSNAPLTAHLVKAIGGQTKLFEMLVLDDEQIDELALTGQTGELHLDDVATMSVKELRAALRETRETAEVRARLVADKDAKINSLTEETRKIKKKHVATATPDQIGADIRREASQIAYAAESEVRGNLRKAFEALHAHTNESEIPHDDFMAGLLCQIEHAVKQLRGEFGIKDKPDGEEVPDWMRDGATE